MKKEMKKYRAFTLIEMLIVMGIIIILMAAGIAGGRFALQRANRIQKQSAVDNLEQALWGYYTDKRSFPRDRSNNNWAVSPRDMFDLDKDYLAKYIDAGQFDGGADGDFYYWVDIGTGQEFVVCASLGGHEDEQNLGIYCSGNGIGTEGSLSGVFSDSPPPDNIYKEGHPDYSKVKNVDSSHAGSYSEWDGENRVWKNF